MGAFFSPDTPPAQPSIVDAMYGQYPALQKYGIQFQDSTSGGVDWRGEPHNGRMMEFYPPNEEWNPKKGKPTIEQFSKNASPVDAFGEVFSHYLPTVDPSFAEGRKAFIGSLDYNQKRMLTGDYQHQVDSGVFGKKVPTFDDWINNQGGDAFFRGYVTKQYPQEFYRPDQVNLFNQLLNKLR